MEQPKPWKPDRPTSKGAIAYHDAVSNAVYYIASLDELMRIAVQKIRQNDIVVDFGAGTGVSAIRLLTHLKVGVNLWLVDNSPAWLGKAYEFLSNRQNIKFFVLDKKGEGYATLAESIGSNAAHHVVSANTVHLVPNLKETFKGIASALKEDGTFIFQSGNITRRDRPNGVLMVDDTVKRVHDIALEIVRTDARFAAYRSDLDARIKQSESQRKFVFPDPKPIEVYLEALEHAGFEYSKPHCKTFKVDYDDWLNFLRVRRLQAGILPEIGGNKPSPKEETDRDTLITIATKSLFKELQSSNPMADNKGFTIEFVYVTAHKKPAYYKQRLGLTGKTALVTGASRGIGSAIAIELAKNGANVIVNYNKSEKGALEVVEEIKGHVKCIAAKADVGNFEEVRNMAELISREFGKIDIIVNNAGIIMDKTLQNMGQEEWNNVISTNLNGIFNVTRNMLPLMNAQGSIINISSIVALDGNFGQTNYAAAKAGIIGFTKSLAKELGKHGITVNAIAPGFIETGILQSIPPQKKREFVSLIPLGYFGAPEDVANLAVFLSSDMARYITGEVLCVNGGLRI